VRCIIVDFNVKTHAHADMLGSMKVLAATLDDDLDERELNLLSVAFKNVVSGLRRARSIVKQIEDAERDECRAGLAKSYREKIERETREVCADAVRVLESRMTNGRSIAIGGRVFCLKMMGDYWRYMCEIVQDDEELDARMAETKERAEDAYRAGIELAAQHLPCCHPVRLGLHLNYSVFHYEIMGRKEHACTMAEAALTGAMDAAAETLDEAAYNDAMSIMRLMENNLQMWREDMREDARQRDLDTLEHLHLRETSASMTESTAKATEIKTEIKTDPTSTDEHPAA